MVTCFLCQKVFINNLGGQFTNHLQEIHNLSLEDYVVLTEYNGIAPKCACNLCNERPYFKRGKFLAFAKFHQSFKERERLWIEKYGIPKCPICNSEVKFARGTPKKYCSTSCSMKDGKGFANPQIQKKISDVVMNRYGVSNISQHPDVKKKLSEKLKGSRLGKKSSLTARENIGISVKLRWQDKEFRKRVSENIKFSINNNQKEINRRKQWLVNKHSDLQFKKNLFNSTKNRLSKLHQKIKSFLKLEDLGFLSEQQIGRYFVDELHKENNIVVEIFGDYTHANPKKFKNNDLIRLPGQSYLAQTKRMQDDKRLTHLRELGYKVIVIWESDDLELKRQEIMSLL